MKKYYLIVIKFGNNDTDIIKTLYLTNRFFTIFNKIQLL